jgi:hypothetical protein
LEADLKSHHAYDKTNIAPRFSLAYKLSKYAQASLAYGIFYQNPKEDICLHDNIDIYEANTLYCTVHEGDQYEDFPCGNLL